MKNGFWVFENGVYTPKQSINFDREHDFTDFTMAVLISLDDMSTWYVNNSLFTILYDCKYCYTATMRIILCHNHRISSRDAHPSMQHIFCKHYTDFSNLNLVASIFNIWRREISMRTIICRIKCLILIVEFDDAHSWLLTLPMRPHQDLKPVLCCE
jgi:hypothetical protein